MRLHINHPLFNDINRKNLADGLGLMMYEHAFDLSP